MDGKIALDTMKSFKTLMSPEDFDAFAKGEDSTALRAFPEVQEFLKGCGAGASADEGEGKKQEGEEEGKEENAEKLEKAQQDVLAAKTALQAAEAALAAIEKPAAEQPVTTVTVEMFKSLQDEIGGKLKIMTDTIAKAINTGDNTEISEIRKSIENVAKVVDKIAGMPLGTKAVQNANFFEKGLGGQEEVTDDKGKKVLSVATQKPQVLKALEDGFEKASDNELRRAYETSIINYNAGGGTIAAVAAKDLFENHNVRLTQ